MPEQGVQLVAQSLELALGGFAGHCDVVAVVACRLYARN